MQPPRHYVYLAWLVSGPQVASRVAAQVAERVADKIADKVARKLSARISDQGTRPW